MNIPARALLLGALLAAPGSASAHNPIEGGSNFYNGLLHPFFVPAHLLLLVALGLFVGQHGIRENRAPIAAFLAATTVGLVGGWFAAGGEMEVFFLGGGAAIGLLVASNLSVGPYWCSVLAALAGLSLGMDSTQEALPAAEKVISLFGSGVGICLLFLYMVALAGYVNKEKVWQRTGVRIVGSWVAASCVLVLALSLASRS